jgi:hypothetical protein
MEANPIPVFIDNHINLNTNELHYEEIISKAPLALQNQNREFFSASERSPFLPICVLIGSEFTKH